MVGMIEHADGLFPRDGRKGLKPVVKADAGLQILKQAAHRKPRAVKARGPTDAPRVDPDQRLTGVGKKRVLHACVVIDGGRVKTKTGASGKERTRVGRVAGLPSTDIGRNLFS